MTRAASSNIRIPETRAKECEGSKEPNRKLIIVSVRRYGLEKETRYAYRVLWGKLLKSDYLENREEHERI
jgi:hypothetical protein